MLLRRYHDRSDNIEDDVNKGSDDETIEEISEDSDKGGEKLRKGKRKQV